MSRTNGLPGEKVEGRAPASPLHQQRYVGVAGAPPSIMIAVLLVLCVTISAVEGATFRFAGVPIAAGATVRADVPLSAAEKQYASDAANKVPDTGIAVIALPPKFDSKRPCPILVVFSTTDFQRLNRDDLVDFYRDAALKEGWLVIAGDGRQFPAHDTNGWRAAMTLAALDELHRSFPDSSRWPVALAGFSGGAKRASVLAPILVIKGCRLCGIYLTGVNEDVLSLSYRKSHLAKPFVETPVFISSGTNDPIAPVNRARAVADSIKSAGFGHVRFETFSGGHVVKNAHTIEALRWFRENSSL